MSSKMEINGIEYVEKSKLDKANAEIQSISKERKKLIEALCMIFPIDEDEAEQIFKLHRPMDILTGRIGLGENERLRYEKEIYRLKCELTGAKAQIGILNKKLSKLDSGEVMLTKVQESLLIKLKDVLDKILEN